MGSAVSFTEVTFYTAQIEKIERYTMEPLEENALTRKLRLFAPLSPRERRWLEQLGSAIRTVEPKHEFVRPKAADGSIFVLLSGWAYRYKTLPDGRRQVVNLILPGDLIGVRAHLFGMADHSTATLTEAAVSPLSASDILQLYRDFPKLAVGLAWSAAREEAMLAEHIVSLGRRSAFERLAYLFIELYERLEVVGFIRGSSFAFPVTQQILADLVGLSEVHVNRTLRRLRQEGLVRLDGGRAFLDDIRRLARIAAFDSANISGKQTPAATEAELVQIGRRRRSTGGTPIG